MNTITPSQSGFPSGLLRAKPPPERIYYDGDLGVFSRPSLSVIGSRAMSPYGAAVLKLFIPTLAQVGLTIVSGLAYGVDAEAHRIALAHNGSCVAVLGSALDRLYPANHTQLAGNIVEQGGVVMSEYPPGTPGHKALFPQRNRLIAALSPVLLIIEAAEKSGTFSTARAALDLGKDVCVVPADITRIQSAGTLSLLKQGARPVSEPMDILALYQMAIPMDAMLPLKPALTGSPATLYACISHGHTNIDTFVQETGWDISTVHSVLSVLELDGYITYRNRQWLTTS